MYPTFPISQNNQRFDKFLFIEIFQLKNEEGKIKVELSPIRNPLWVDHEWH